MNFKHIPVTIINHDRSIEGLTLEREAPPVTGIYDWGTMHWDRGTPGAKRSVLGRGWQRAAPRAVDDQAAETLLAALDARCAALVEPQTGTLASRVFLALPTAAEFRLDLLSMRVLLLRRLRLPLPLAAATCHCRRVLDVFGDHWAACPRSGLLRPRTVPLERAAACVCREAGATVACNVRIRDFNLELDRLNDRRIEVIANGLPLWGGAQLAVNVTLVSALETNGVPLESGSSAFRPPPCPLQGSCRAPRLP